MSRLRGFPIVLAAVFLLIVGLGFAKDFLGDFSVAEIGFAALTELLISSFPLALSITLFRAYFGGLGFDLNRLALLFVSVCTFLAGLGFLVSPVRDFTILDLALGVRFIAPVLAATLLFALSVHAGRACFRN
ncbi:MAG: hypothetical protein HY506_00365 [Candidatus Yanofskybacteria bacterium]|nr:hypothetical protein [Candidatus Yanofskybacteria bacterium]